MGDFLLVKIMEKYYVAAISGIRYFGSVRVQQLVKFFGDAKMAWTAEKSDLEKVGLPDVALINFLEFRADNPDAPQELFNYCNEKKVGLCSIYDEDYPPNLKEIPTPPPVFYYYGRLQPLAEKIAMVGSRECTDYGQRAALEISEELAAKGVTVVSGAAQGIDTYSHMGAMKKGRTIAVLGFGIDYAFLLSNGKLIQEIAENGVVMSEFKPDQSPTKYSFPARNRIIAGLSRGIIVVEAAEHSGANIACKYAAESKRDIFAVPGSIYSDKSVSCNNLIRGSATLIRSAADVLDFYHW